MSIVERVFIIVQLCLKLRLVFNKRQKYFLEEGYQKDLDDLLFKIDKKDYEDRGISSLVVEWKKGKRRYFNMGSEGRNVCYIGASYKK